MGIAEVLNKVLQNKRNFELVKETPNVMEVRVVASF